jgi:hypothetical protein
MLSSSSPSLSLSLSLWRIERRIGEEWYVECDDVTMMMLLVITQQTKTEEIGRKSRGNKFFEGCVTNKNSRGACLVKKLKIVPS